MMTSLLAGGGEMGMRIRDYDWSVTPLGPIESWPVSLRTTVGIILRSPVPIVVLWGEQGTMIYNDAYSGFAGGRHPWLLGSPVREGWPEVAEFNDNVMRVGLAGGVLSYQDQELTLHRSGRPEQVFMNLDYSPVIGEAGVPVGVIALVYETTQRVMTQRRLETVAGKLAFLDQLSRVASVSRDADAIMAASTRLLGEHIGADICAYADMEPDQDHFTIRGDWQREGRGSIVGYYSLADFGQRAVHDLTAGQPLLVNDTFIELDEAGAATFASIGIAATICMPLVKAGRLTALMAVHSAVPRRWTDDEIELVLDVTERCWAHIERVRSEAALRASEEQFRSFAQVVPNHVWTTTPDGHLDWCNERTLTYAGVELKDVSGMEWSSIVHPDEREASEAVWQASLDEGIAYENEFRLRRHDGTWRWHLARAVPLRDEAGKVVRWVGTNTDVHDQKHAEEVLEQRLNLRTEELERAGEVLRQVQKMEAIGNLTGGIAHDFNNLLVAVIGSMELLRKRMPQDPALLKLVDTALEGAQRGASLTQRMLAFARRQDLQMGPVQISGLVHGMGELLQRALGAMIPVDFDIPDGLPAVQTDQNQLESALLNLAVNARDAMEAGGRLTIAARTGNAVEGDRLRPGRYVCLSVTDTGTGMDDATRARAMDPFFTTKGVGKGTGLGLSMVHGLAEQSGGALVLKSRKGQGTTAEIWLPLASAVESIVSEQIQPASVASQTAPGAEPRKLRVLAVDDDALVLMNTVAILEDLGHEVDSAMSGEKALIRLAEQEFDLVMTDHAMPGMTGVELAERIRQMKPGMPIVLATGYAELPAGQQSSLPRLPKPFWQSDVEDVLQRVLSSSPASRS